MLLASYHEMIKFQNKFAPMQNKIMKFMQREIDDMEETENWKLDDEDDQPQDDQDNDIDE